MQRICNGPILKQTTGASDKGAAPAAGGGGGGGGGGGEARKKTTIFIANLASEQTNERELRDIFSKHGNGFVTGW